MTSSFPFFKPKPISVIHDRNLYIFAKVVLGCKDDPIVGMQNRTMKVQSRLNSAQFVHTKDNDEVANLQQQRTKPLNFYSYVVCICSQCT